MGIIHVDTIAETLRKDSNTKTHQAPPCCHRDLFLILGRIIFSRPKTKIMLDPFKNIFYQSRAWLLCDSPPHLPWEPSMSMGLHTPKAAFCIPACIQGLETTVLLPEYEKLFYVPLFKAIRFYLTAFDIYKY